MTKEQLIDRHAQTLKSWVGTGLAKDECIGLIKNAVDEALFLYGVSNQRELLICESCGDEFKPIDKLNFHCEDCQPCKPLANL